MLRFIYALPITYIILLLAVMPVVWGYLFVKIRKPHWQIMNGLLAIAAAAAVLYATLISREPGTFSAFQKPFAKLADAHVQPELYREMLMNVFLFFPFGLTLSNALPRKLNLWGKISLTAFIGCALSLGIEYSQYRYAFGMAETDDVICNTLGVFIGSSSLLIAHAIEKQKERSRQAMTTLTQTETQFLTLIRAAVSGGSCPAENVNWHAVFSLASEQKLLPVLFEAALRMPVTEDNSDLFTSTKQKVIGQVLGQTMRSEKFADLYRKLRAEGLHPIVVKGQLCSRLYPLKDYRLSSDDDLYITEDEFFDCHGTLLANGLSADTSEEELKTADEVTYLKKDGSLHIELHRRLFDSSGDADDESNRFFADISPTEIDGYLAMPPHLHLLYLLLH
ncbi:MAG: nucleotidyltransferase family protein, partial [Firmicutes bacterium]|nr:nucleotidyltransferase family protein [Bacillota bacterium]